jgi:lysozyme
MNLVEQLTRDEGMRLHPYRDTVGKLTIGVGRNLDDVGISIGEAEALLVNDIAVASKNLEQAFPWTSGLDEARRNALVAMVFNMGVFGLGKFVRFLAAMRAADWNAAHDEMLSSLWAVQVGPRALRLAVQIQVGEMQ